MGLTGKVTMVMMTLLAFLIREQRNASLNGFFKFLLVYAVRILKETHFIENKN